MAYSLEETKNSNILISFGPNSNIRRAPRVRGIEGVIVSTCGQITQEDRCSLVIESFIFKAERDVKTLDVGISNHWANG